MSMSEAIYENEGSLVSIIVPVYNVEKYVTKCINSILGQTYRTIEVIVIDDGSTDGSGAILEHLSNKDSRLRVIYTSNGGVSSARNLGIESARGNYIVFVDGDDSIADDYVEYLVCLINKADSGFSMSRTQYINSNEKQVESDNIDVLPPNKALALLLSPDTVVGSWNKIYRREFLNKYGIRFSSDLYYGEGLKFIISCAYYSNTTVVGTRKIYFYRKNNLSSATTVFDINKYLNGEKSLDEIKYYCDFDDLYLRTMYVLHRATFSLNVLSGLLANNQKGKHQDNFKHFQSYLRSNLLFLLSSKYVSTYRKAMLLCGALSPRVISILDSKRKALIRNGSIE